MSRLVESGGASQITFRVASRALDSLLDEGGLNKIDVIKIDVEGAEHLVLAGMEEGLKRFRYRCLLLELHPLHPGERRPGMRQVMDDLISKGYRGFALDYSYAATRLASYKPDMHFTKFIKPLARALADPWPHTVWICPGEDLNAA
jgi:hypothetical protein